MCCRRKAPPLTRKPPYRPSLAPHLLSPPPSHPEHLQTLTSALLPRRPYTVAFASSFNATMDEKIFKWLPPEEPDAGRFYSESRTLYNAAKSLAATLSTILAKSKAGLAVDVLELDCTSPLRALVDGLVKVNMYKGDTTGLLSHKRNSWRQRLWVERLAISRLLYEIINTFLDTKLVEVTLRLAHLYNETLAIAAATPSVNVYCNTCPMLLHPLRKLTAPRLLQMLAQKRAETSSYLLLDSLLVGYLPPGVPPPEPPLHTSPSPPLSTQPHLPQQDSVSSDTSVEIFRALTQHLEGAEHGGEKVPMSCLQALLKMEEQRVSAFLNVTARLAPQLLAAHCVKPSAISGEPKVKRPVKKKLVEYYQDVLWGEVGGYLEHGLLWWSPDPLGSFAPTHAHHLRDHLSRLKDIDFIPDSLLAATNSLLDALCCHTTSTSWDQLFRSTLVTAACLPGYRNSDFGPQGSHTGGHFVALLADLVQLNNECENGCMTLEQLPLVEQIPVLHRLDHSVHTARLWAADRCRQLAATWTVAQFYCIAHTDISLCLGVLNKLEMATDVKIPPTTSVHVAVCAKMRVKLVSEVRANVDKLRGTLAECVDVLASNCRTHCLAHLHMTCPPPLYWRQSGPLPDCASEYVENYLDCILKPVLLATDQLPQTVQVSSAAMALRIVCESWLEYIYLHRYKFSEWGAVQLLTDFGAVPTWLMERVKLPKDLLNPLLSHEVLRRCEGVGRLLLRRPGESIAMTAPLGQRSTAHEEKSADNMPAEMYVTNQEQWLELRAPRTGNMCCQL